MIDSIKMFVSKYSVSTITLIAMAFSLLGATSAVALTASDVSMLQSAGIISASQASMLIATLSPAPAVSSSYKFAKDLTVGSRGADVTALQNMLGISPATGYFGSLTKAAVAKFQLSKGIAPAAGYFGPKTRAVANASVASSNVELPVVVASGDFSVALAPTSPASSALIAGQSAADLVEYVFSNKTASAVVVTNITLQRTGVSSDSALSNVFLYNGATRLTDSASVSVGKISFNAGSGIFTIPANSSMTISVRADIDSSANGQLIAISLASVSASAPISSVYPISGSSMSVFVSADVAKATSTLVGGLGSSVSAGSLGQVIWATNLGLSGRAVYLKSLALKVIGSVPAGSLENIKLYSSGIQVASALGVDSNGMVNFDLSSAPHKMDSSRTLEVRADVVGGASRSFSVSLQNASDLAVIDSNYGVGIAVALSGTQSTNSFSVSSGSATVSSDSSLSARDVVTGASDVVLGRFTLKAYGEEIKISELLVSSNAKLDNVNLFINGSQVGSTRSITATGTPALFNVNSIISAGQSVSVEVRADIKANGVNLSVGSGVKVTLSGSAGNTTGRVSYSTSQTPSVAMEGPSMSVVGAGLTVAKNVSVSNGSVSPNSLVKVGSFIIQTNSSEPVRISNLNVALSGTVSATSSLSNLYVVADGVSSNPVNPQSSNNFSVNLSVPMSSSRIVDVFANTSSSEGSIIATLSLNGYGANSNIIIASSPVVGQTMQVGSGSLATPTKANTSPSARLVLGSVESKIVDLKFVSSGGSSAISEMSFDVSGPVVSLSVDGRSSVVVSGSSTVTGLNLSIPVGYGGKVVPVTVSYAIVGLNGEASMQTALVTLTGYKYSSGNSVVTATSSVSSNGMVVVGSKPIVSLLEPAQKVVLSGGTVILGRVSVTADVGGEVSLLELPIRVSTTANSSGSSIGTSNKVKVGSSLVSTTGGISVASSSSNVDGVISFGPDGYSILAGETVTFDIYGTVSLLDGNSVQLSIPSATSFVWKDVKGNATTTGALIYGFPDNTVTVSY